MAMDQQVGRPLRAHQGLAVAEQFGHVLALGRTRATQRACNVVKAQHPVVAQRLVGVELPGKRRLRVQDRDGVADVGGRMLGQLVQTTDRQLEAFPRHDHPLSHPSASGPAVPALAR